MRAQKQKGQVRPMAALSLAVLIGSVGLAINSGLGYMIKAKLNAAVDSASIAAARALSQGTDQAAQTARAQQAAREFFAANYPEGYLGSTPTFNEPTITFDQGKVTIDATASAVVPVNFMRPLNFNLLRVSASGQTIRRHLDMAFVVDTSGSLEPSRVQVRDNAKLFLTKFNPTLDRMALIHFSHGAVVDDAIRPVQRGFDRSSMDSHIDNFNFDGLTNSAEGFRNARDQLNRIAQASRSSLRVIVFFSDGAPHADPATDANLDEFRAAGGGPRPATSAPSSANVNPASRNLVEAMAAKARSEGIYVFTLGLGAQLPTGIGPDGERGDLVLKCMANTADARPSCVAAGAGQPVGMYCHAVDANALKHCFVKLASAILRITR